MSKLVAIHNITKTYSTQDGSVCRTVLQDLSLDMVKGDSVAILGPSGSGKSTLLNIIGALDRPDSGRVLFSGQDLSKMSERERDLFRNQKVGFVFQQHHLLPQHTVWENILIPVLATPSGARRKKECMEWGDFLLESCGMADRRFQRPGQLSGGECLRTALVRALINKPALLLADEPTGSLDRATADAVGDLLVRLNKELGTALLVVTHADFIAEKMNQQLFLENGALQRRSGLK